MSVWVQRVLLIIELVMLVAFAVTAFVKVGAGHAPAGHLAPAAAWFNPFGTGSFGTLTNGLLVAVFVYWGWDSAVSVNEETQDPHRNPGRAVVISMALLIGIFLATTIAAQSYAGVAPTGSAWAAPARPATCWPSSAPRSSARHGANCSSWPFSARRSPPCRPASCPPPALSCRWPSTAQCRRISPG